MAPVATACADRSAIILATVGVLADLLPAIDRVDYVSRAQQI
jgi:hypothetical protein